MDALQASPGLAAGASGGRSGGGGGADIRARGEGEKGKRRGEDGGRGGQTKREMVVKLVQTAFQYGFLAEEATWQAVVLIPKGGGDYRSIGLVEVVRKAVVVIINRGFTTSITYHDSLHGFRAGRGTGTTTLKVKLLQRVMAMREAFLHAFFLDLHKAYDDLDRYKYLEILEGYDGGPRAFCLLRRYWERLQMVGWAGGVLHRTLPRRERRDAGVPTVSRHIQCGGGRSGPTWESLVAEIAGGGASATTEIWHSRREGKSRKGTTDEGGWRRNMHG